MRHFALNVPLMVVLVSAAACGQDMNQDMSTEGIIRSAVSAGPASITDEAAVSDWDMNRGPCGHQRMDLPARPSGYGWR